MSPDKSDSRRDRTNSSCRPDVTKQISWLSFLSATRNPTSAAIARIAGFSKSPTGNSMRRSRLRSIPNSTYDWSFPASTPRRSAGSPAVRARTRRR